MFTFIGLRVSHCPVALVWPETASSLVLLDSHFEDVGTIVEEVVSANGTSGSAFLYFDRVSLTRVANLTLNHTAHNIRSLQSWRHGPALVKGVPLLGESGNLPATRSDTPLEQRSRPVVGRTAVSVTDYGAKGDGRTDDAQAFQAAIDACDEVFVPYGRYVLGTTIHLRSTTTLFGELYSLLIASNTSSAFRRSPSDWRR